MRPDGRRARTAGRAVIVPDAGGRVDVPGRRVVATRGRPGGTRSGEDRRRAGRRASWPNDLEPARGCWTGRAGCDARTRAACCCAPPRRRLRDARCRWPTGLGRRAGRGGARRHARAPGARAGHRGRAAPRVGGPAEGARSAPGTSSSRAPPAASDATAGRCTARSPPRRAELAAVAAMGFDVVYLPPIHPIGEVNRKGRNNTLVAEPGDVGSPWAIGSAEGGHDAVHPDAGHARRLRRVRGAAPPSSGIEVALDLALQCAPDHPWVREHPEWFTTPPGRHDRVRGEPAQEVPGHLPAELRQRPEGPVRRGAAACVLHWVDHGRADLPGRQPAHQAAGLLAVADRARSSDRTRTCCSWPRRSPGRRACYGLASLGFTQSYTYFTWRTTKAELSEFGAELAAHARRGPAEPVRRTRRTSCPSTCSTAAPAMFAHPRRAGRDAVADLGRVLRLRAVRARGRARRAARSTWTPRSTSCGRATARARGQGASWSRG